MGEVDRIQPVQPAMIQSQASSHISMRKEGRQQGSERQPHDILDLHEASEEAVEEETPVEDDGPEDHGLDLVA
jgi:hypothetical protein